VHVSQSNKQVGDLIFFGSPGSIYHEASMPATARCGVAPHTGTTVQLQTIYTTSYLVGRVM